MEFLALEDVLELHRLQLKRFGGADGLGDRGLLESAIAQPCADAEIECPARELKAISTDARRLTIAPYALDLPTGELVVRAIVNERVAAHRVESGTVGLVVGTPMIWSVVQRGTTDATPPRLLGQDGSDRARDGRLILHADGKLGREVAALLQVRDEHGQVVAQKPGYPPVEVAVTMVRSSDDPTDAGYNLYLEQDDRPLVLAAVPTAQLRDLPANAIVLQDDPEFLFFRTCRQDDGPCQAGVSGAFLEDLQAAHDTIEFAFERSIRVVRFAIDVGVGCPAEAEFNDASFSQCRELQLDVFDGTESKTTFVIPWTTKSADGDEAATAGPTGNNYLRIRLSGLEEAAALERDGTLQALRFPREFQVTRLFEDDVNSGSNVSEETVNAALLNYLRPEAPVTVNLAGLSFTRGEDHSYITATGAAVETQRLAGGGAVRAGNPNPAQPTSRDLHGFRPATAGEAYAVYKLTADDPPAAANALPQSVDAPVPPPFLPDQRGKRTPSEGYQMGPGELRVEVEYLVDADLGPPKKVADRFEAVVEQTVRAVVVQEYWDHYPYRGPRYNDDGTIRDFLGKRINCTAAGAIGSDGTCGTKVHPWPGVDDFSAPVATPNYTTTGGCGSLGNLNCLDLVSGNYYNDGVDPLTFGRPLDYAEDVRAQWSSDLGFATTPFITSAWRNPERNEAVLGAINSNHQWGAAMDMRANPQQAADLPMVYAPANPDAAPATWCQLAASAFAVPDPIEVLVENTQSGVPGSDIYYTWTGASTLIACVTAVRQRIEGCIPQVDNPDPDEQRRICSPSHVHTARR